MIYFYYICVNTKLYIVITIPNKMAKELSTFRLSENAKKLLKAIALKDDRSEAYIIEKLIEKEADRLKIKPAKP